MLVNTALGGVLLAVMKIRLNLLFDQGGQQNQGDVKGKEVFLFKLGVCL